MSRSRHTEGQMIASLQDGNGGTEPHRALDTCQLRIAGLLVKAELRSYRHQRETEPSSEPRFAKTGLTSLKRESTILLDPRSLESLFCFFSPIAVCATSRFLCPKQEISNEEVRSIFMEQSGRSGHRGICSDVGCHTRDRGWHDSLGRFECQ